MSNATTTSTARREPELLGQTVVLIGGSAGIGLETAGAHAPRAPRSSSPAAIRSVSSARRARSARSSTAAFDADDAAAVKGFFEDLPGPIDHVLITAYSAHTGPCSKWTLRRWATASPST